MLVPALSPAAAVPRMELPPLSPGIQASVMDDAEVLETVRRGWSGGTREEGKACEHLARISWKYPKLCAPKGGMPMRLPAQPWASESPSLRKDPAVLCPPGAAGKRERRLTVPSAQEWDHAGAEP